MEPLSGLDNVFLATIHALVFAFTILRLNSMHLKRPTVAMAAWWALGTGSFIEMMSYAGGSETDWSAVLTSMGVLFLVLLLTQPEWRPYFLDRRVNPEQGLPPNCDRRCQALMGARRDKRTHPWAA